MVRGRAKVRVRGRVRVRVRVRIRVGVRDSHTTPRSEGRLRRACSPYDKSRTWALRT